MPIPGIVIGDANSARLVTATPTGADISAHVALDVTSPATISQFDYVGGASIIYAGDAAPGTLTSEAGWSIQKFTYTGADLTSTAYAGAGAFNQVWDDRASLIYS